MIQRLFIVLALLTLTGCDQVSQKLGMEDPAKKEARLEPEAKAVGSACRHSGRAIEDCYSIYSWLPKAGIYAGWREMDSYMRENEIETVPPQLPPPEPPSLGKKKKKAAATEGEAEGKANGSDKEGESGSKSVEKASEKH
ncbi:hypothetical protein [Azonexus sp. IMCC34839]|uniref:hypothetical protein n=1 Tax=Azonexus sp. IMCC34839 TaxID=3133695 RepID=UPI0039994E8C